MPECTRLLEKTKIRNQSAFRLLVAAGLVVMLSACGGPGRSERPAQVEHRESVPGSPTPGASSGGSGEAQIAAYIPPVQPTIARPEPNRAVSALMRRAEDQRKSGDLDGATVSLERALRIAPEDAVLWHRLAGVRMTQRQYDRVIQLAAKSNALASPGDASLRSSNWQLIAQARRAMGDVSGARDAERRAVSPN
jgi:hypothetical protein